MEIVHNGKKYDTNECRVLVQRDLMSYTSNSYIGGQRISVAEDGTLILWQAPSLHTNDAWIKSKIEVIGCLTKGWSALEF